MTRQINIKLLTTASLAIQMLAIFVSTSNAASYLTCNELGSKWQDVSGKWIASVGPAIFTVDGLPVTGIYNQDTWSLNLRYSDDRSNLSGRWSHRNGLEGPVIFHLDKAGCIKHARWGGVGKKVCNEYDSTACIHNWAFHGRAKK